MTCAFFRRYGTPYDDCTPWDFWENDDSRQVLLFVVLSLFSTRRCRSIQWASTSGSQRLPIIRTSFSGHLQRKCQRHCCLTCLPGNEILLLTVLFLTKHTLRADIH